MVVFLLLLLAVVLAFAFAVLFTTRGGLRRAKASKLLLLANGGTPLPLLAIYDDFAAASDDGCGEGVGGGVESEMEEVEDGTNGIAVTATAATATMIGLLESA
jgi:hypothetical protein